jgi:hypothetical protein
MKNCCGKKRTEFLDELTRPSSKNIKPVFTERNKKNTGPRVFEYIGLVSFSVKGISSSTVYRFKFPGDKLEVEYEDSFALMAENELKLVAK